MQIISTNCFRICHTEDHSNCLSVQFCDQQHRFGYAGTGIASGSDDDLSGDRCACDSFVFQEVDWKSKDGICTRMLFAFCVAFVDGMQSVKIMLGPVTEFCRQLPFYGLRLGWIIPAVAGALLGLLPIWKYNRE